MSAAIIKPISSLYMPHCHLPVATSPTGHRYINIPPHSYHTHAQRGQKNINYKKIKKNNLFHHTFLHLLYYMSIYVCIIYIRPPPKHAYRQIFTFSFYKSLTTAHTRYNTKRKIRIKSPDYSKYNQKCLFSLILPKQKVSKTS